MKDSITVIIPAFNEELNIKDAIKMAKKALVKLHIPFEILVIDDGSRDTTVLSAQKVAKLDKRIKVIQHKSNLGMGAAYKTGIKKAAMSYISWFPGDNDTSSESLYNLIHERKNADIITAYSDNPAARNWIRRVISRSFVVMMNVLFGLHLRYYNGLSVISTALLRSIPIQSNSFTAFAEAKVRLLKKGCSYKEIPFTHIGRKHGNSKAVTTKSVVNTMHMVVNLMHTS